MKVKSLIADVNKFSFAQMTSNSDGKTSGSGTMGIVICMAGTLGFIAGCVDKMFYSKTIDIMTQSIIFVGIGAGLLGYRKSKDSGISISDNVNTTISDTPPAPTEPVAPAAPAANTPTQINS